MARGMIEDEYSIGYFDSSGRMYVVSTDHVVVYGPDGAFLNRIGRRGEEPGEMLDVAAIAVVEDGVLVVFSEADLDKRFLYYFLFQRTQEIKSAGHGVSMVHMTKGKMERLAVLLPPLTEQRRIVAKVDQLMALCDRLEAGLDAADTTRDCLLESLLHDTLAPTARAAVTAGTAGA